MPHHRTRRSSRPLIALGFCLLLGACAKAHVDVTERYTGEALARPTRVLVQDFAIDPAEVRLDQGIRSRIMREVSDTSLSAAQQAAATKARTAMTTALVQRLRSYGLPAEPAPPGGDAGPGPTVIVQGQIVSEDEGNRTRRTLIGLGSGASNLAVDAQAYYVQGTASPRLLEGFTVKGDSGQAPGVAETMGVGAAADRAATSAAVGVGMHGANDYRSAGDDDNGRRAGEALAVDLGKFFAGLGWNAQPPGS
jgi:hypothetical protein